MILEFAISNYRSIKDLLVIDFKTSEISLDSKYKNLVKEYNGGSVTRINFVYGKNGSGKTTIYKAIKSLANIAIKNPKFMDADTHLSYLDIVPFKLTKEKLPNTLLGIKFIRNETVYRYTINYDNQNKILEDEMFEVFIDGEFKELFSKNNDLYQSLNNSELERLKTYNLNQYSIGYVLSNEINLSNNSLLNHMKNFNDFFSNINFNFNKINNPQNILHLINNNDELEIIKDKVRKFDLTISDIKVKEEYGNFQDFKKRYTNIFNENDYENRDVILKSMYENQKFKIDFFHKENPLSYNEESDGTKKALDAIFSVNSSKKGVWIIDDFEKDLHPESANELIKYIAREFPDHQFIFITHNLDLLDLEETKFKPSHFFVERDLNDYSTSIDKASSFKDLRQDSRHVWKTFYKKNRLAQYPNIKINR